MADPFFETIPDGEWNACIGVQGDELHYVNGYLEAARMLADTLIDKELIRSRDTLAMPILYNVRHGLELGLKYVLRSLGEIEMARPRQAVDHDILAYWRHLKAADVGDRTARELIDTLEPYVKSLDQIDDDGQELRYFENRDGDQSLADRAVLNLPLVRRSVARLEEILHELTEQVERLADEHPTGTHTARCSRRDLCEIADTIGARATWIEQSFDERKAKICEQFELSGSAFSRALKAIEGSRQLRTRIGMEAELRYLSDAKAVAVAGRWLEDHPPPADAASRMTDPTDITLGEILEYGGKSQKLDSAVAALLTVEEFADLQAIFYIGRDARFGEEYERTLEGTLAAHRQEKDRWSLVHHIMSKTSFLTGFTQGLARVGKRALAERLSGLGDAAARTR